MCAHMFVSNNANTRTYGPNTTTRLTRKQCQMAMAEDFCVIPPDGPQYCLVTIRHNARARNGTVHRVLNLSVHIFVVGFPAAGFY